MRVHSPGATLSSRELKPGRLAADGHRGRGPEAAGDGAGVERAASLFARVGRRLALHVDGHEAVGMGERAGVGDRADEHPCLVGTGRLRPRWTRAGRLGAGVRRASVCSAGVDGDRLLVVGPVLAAELVRAGSLDDGQLGCRVELGRREPGRRSTEAEVQVHLEGAARRALGPEIHPRLARTGAVGARDRAPPAAARVDEHRTGAAVAGARDKDARRGEVARTAQDKAERLPAIQAGDPSDRIAHRPGRRTTRARISHVHCGGGGGGSKPEPASTSIADAAKQTTRMAIRFARLLMIAMTACFDDSFTTPATPTNAATPATMGTAQTTASSSAPSSPPNSPLSYA